MKTKMWAGVLMAGLCQAASASAVVTFEGVYTFGTKNTYCSGGVSCGSKDVTFEPTPFRLTFALEFGTNVAGAPIFTTVRTVHDTTTGLSYDSLSATQRHARWNASGPAAAQVPAIPLTESTADMEQAGATVSSDNYAYRSRSLTYWVNDWPTHQVRTTTTQSWALGSNLTWLNSDGTGYQNRFALSGSAPFGTTADNYADLQSSDYFLSLLTGAIDCANCVRLTLSQVVIGPDGTGSDVNVTGVGRFISIVNTAAVPEPASYALMLAGLGVMGAVLRRQRAQRAGRVAT